MKKILAFIVAFIVAKTAISQIGLGITTPHPNAYFEINSTNKGVLLPRMTALQRIAIAPAATANGLIVFDTDSSAYLFWTGTAWKKMGSDDGNWIRSGNHIYNSNPGRVGIGTNAPLARLHVADSAVVFTAPLASLSTTVHPAVTGNGTRMLWYPQKAAFRAGVIDDQAYPSDPTFWDRDNIGAYSAAFGQNNKAKGIGDFVAGLGNTSDGGPSALFGLGNQNTGFINFCAGEGNHLNGSYNTAIGTSNYTDGMYSSAIGLNNLVNDSSIALGNGNNTAVSSVHLGYYNTTEGIYNMAMGYDNKAKGIFSVALGSQSLAHGNSAISIGNGNSVIGDNAAAIGHRLQVNSNNVLAVGSYNEPGGSVMKAFEVGIGTSLVPRNGFTVTQNGYTGINTANPTTELDVYGNTSLNGNLILNGFFRYPIVTAANNRVLVSDAIGNANWADASSVMSSYWTANSNDVYNNNTGNVGIGNSTPVSPLSFANSLGNKISLYGTSASNQYGMGIQGSLLQVYSSGSGDDIAFGYGSSTNFTERMRIKGDGNVGIGNTDPGFRLDVNGRMRIRSGGDNNSTAGIWLNNNANSASPAFVGMESDDAVGFYGNGTPNGWGVVMKIGTGNVGIGTSIPAEKLHVVGNILATGTITPSDIRYKNSIATIQNPLLKLAALHGVTYFMNREAHPEWQFDSTLQYGLIAQEVEKVFPEIVKVISADGYKGLDYVKLVPVLLEGIKELDKKNNQLTGDNQMMRERLAILEEKVNALINEKPVK